MGKHVIFLGAGASWSSGYPLAAELRVILSSQVAFDRYVESKVPQHRPVLRQKLSALFSQNNKAVQLFREGGFATIDEFSFLAQKQLATEISKMKQLMTLVLAIHNPESGYTNPSNKQQTTGFESSDYYPFLQKLFAENLHDLRKDVVVLSYNYDSYLDFLLWRGTNRRKASVHHGVEVALQARVTGGFFERNAAALDAGGEFLLLKLHGTVAEPWLPIMQGQHPEYLTYGAVFIDQSGIEAQLEQPGFLNSPVFFPWELISQNKTIITQEEFAEHEAAASNNLIYQQQKKKLYPVFSKTWERAQLEVAEAETISFVGMSFHDFLKGGFEYLFAKRGIKPLAGLVFADPQCGKASTAEQTPMVRRARKMLQQACPSIIGDIGTTRMRLHENFATFIREELTQV